jgi:hypothetical protein
MGDHVSLVAVVAVTPRTPWRDLALTDLAEAVGALRGEAVREVVSGARVTAALLGPRADVDAGPVHHLPDERQSWSLSTDGFTGDRPVDVLMAWQRQLAVVGYDARRDEVVIGPDGLGLMTLYFCRFGDGLLVSTSALGLARVARPRVDVLGLRTFLATGMRVGPKTMWEGVQRLDPGTRLLVDASGRQRPHTYWRAEVDPGLWSQPLLPAAERVKAAALEGVSHRLASRSGLVADLTGGYDSRLVCLLLAEAGTRFATTTRSVRDRTDVPTAQRIAALKGWPWVHTPLPAEWATMLPEHVHQALGAGDGALDVLQLARVLEPRAQLSRHFQDVVSGGGGEHLQFAGWKSEFGTAGAAGEPHIARWVRMRLLTKGLAGVLSSDVEDVVSHLSEVLTEWTEPWRSLPRAVQLDGVYAYVKAPAHFGAYRNADATLLEAHLPLYERTTYEAAFTTHYRWRNEHRLMRQMMASLDPAVAGIPTTRGGPAIPRSVGNFPRFAPYFVRLGHKGLGKVTSRLDRQQHLSSDVGQYHWLPEANARLLQTMTEAAHAPSSRLFDEGGLDRVVVLEALQAEACDAYGQAVLLGRLLTAELALNDAGT